MGAGDWRQKGKLWSSTPGVGNFDDGEGDYISTFTAEGHIAYCRVILCHTKIADLQAQNASF